MEKIELVEKSVSSLEESVNSLAEKEISKTVSIDLKDYVEKKDNYGVKIVENDKFKVNSWVDKILL